MSNSWAKPHVIKGQKGTLLLLYVQPGAKKSEWKGLHGDRMKLAIAAPPVDGAANEAVIEFLVEFYLLPKNKINLLSGQTSRMKNVWIELEVPASTGLSKRDP